MIGFRVDANEHIATGHMYRCLAIAEQLRKKNEECIFLTASDSDLEPCVKENFEVIKLDLRSDDWNYGIDALKGCFLKNGVSLLLVDSYKVTPLFFDELWGVIPVFYMDDLCQIAYNVSGVLHYSEWEDEELIAGLYKGKNTAVYSGLKYMPLRSGFDLHGKHDRYDILITTGGSDSCHMTERLLSEIIVSESCNDKSICAVLGKMNKDEERIRGLCEGHSNITVLKNICNMNEIMSESAFALTAGGITVYELMASGVPFACFSFSDDQRIFGEKIEKHGYCGYAGDARKDANSVTLKLLGLMHDYSLLPEGKKDALIKNNRMAVDGKGADRIADVLIEMESKRLFWDAK